MWSRHRHLGPPLLSETSHPLHMFDTPNPTTRETYGFRTMALGKHSNTLGGSDRRPGATFPGGADAMSR